MFPSYLFLVVHVVPVICVCVGIYGIRILMHYKNCAFMQKRSVLLTFGLSASLISSIVSVSIFDLAITYHFEPVPFILCGVYFFASLWLVLFFLNTKNWLIYFKQNWSYLTLQLKWQEIINEEIGKEIKEKNWFIRNDHKYGNLPYIIKVFCIAHIIGCLMCIFAMCLTFFPSIFFPIHSHYKYVIIACLYSCSLIPSILFYTIITLKTPSLKDTFYIHWESKMHSKILISYSISCIIVFCVFFSTKNQTITSMVTVTLLSIIFFIMICVSTFTLIAKNCNDIESDRDRSPSLPKQPSSVKLNKNNNPPELHKKLSIKSIKLKDIFLDKQALNLFMMYLSKEYSMECLLAFIEFTQFEQYALAEMSDHERNEKAVANLTFVEIPSNVPISDIIDSRDDNELNETLLSAKIRAHKLYEKYIKVSSEFQVNISGRMSDEIGVVLSDLNVLKNNTEISLKDLVFLFEAPRHEMMILLQYSFSRFKGTFDFDEIVGILSTTKAKAKNRLTAPVRISINISLSAKPNALQIMNENSSKTSSVSPKTSIGTPITPISPNSRMSRMAPISPISRIAPISPISPRDQSPKNSKIIHSDSNLFDIVFVDP